MLASAPKFRRTVHGVSPGLAVSGVVAIAATFLSLRYNARSMLFALLLGIELNFLDEDGSCVPGIQLAPGLVLRTGVALLGLRITIGDVTSLGWTTATSPVLPWFAVVFAILVVAASSGRIPTPVMDAGSSISRWCLVTAIAAIGMKTSLRSLVDIGFGSVVLLVAETVFLALLVLGVLRFFWSRARAMIS